MLVVPSTFCAQSFSAIADTPADAAYCSSRAGIAMNRVRVKNQGSLRFVKATANDSMSSRVQGKRTSIRVVRSGRLDYSLGVRRVKLMYLRDIFQSADLRSTDGATSTWDRVSKLERLMWWLFLNSNYRAWRPWLPSLPQFVRVCREL